MFDTRAVLKKYRHLIGTKKGTSIKSNVEAEHKDVIEIKRKLKYQIEKKYLVQIY